MRRALLSALAIVAAIGACSDDLAGAGDPCTTSAQCGAGLFCDTSLEPPSCVTMGSPRPDLRGVDQLNGELGGVDLAGVDLAGADLSATANDLASTD